MSTTTSKLSSARAAFDPAVALDAGPERGVSIEAKLMARRLAAHCNAYKGSDTRRAVIQLGTTLTAYIVLCTVMFLAAEPAYWLTLLLTVPAAGLLIRLFIIQHDCGHGSFFGSRKANDWVGRGIAVLSFTPYAYWRRSHAVHHATSGDLDHRGTGDITTLTVREYAALSPLLKLKYRLYRHPLVLLVIGPPVHFLLLQRVPFGMCFPFSQVWRSVVILNLALLAVYGALGALVGYHALLTIYLPVVVIASWIGGWLFFVQHQYEDTNWDNREDWDFQVAALNGSSHYVLHPIVQWFTGNIGLHHIHHLSSMIPNYRLQECLDASPELQQMGRIRFWESLKCMHLALWDEKQRKLITFREFAAAR